MNFIFKMAQWYPDSFMLQKRIDDQPSISREMVREAQSILHQHLKRVGLKQTAQRDTILRSFLETHDHLSTDELHRLVQKKTPASATPPSIEPSNCSPNADWPAKLPFTMASPAMNISTTAAAITTWFARSAAVRWNFFRAKWISSSRKSDARTIIRPLATLFRSMVFVRIAGKSPLVAGRSRLHADPLSRLRCGDAR